MSRFLLTLFGFLAILAIVAESAIVCGPNEEYRECGSPNPLTCKNPIPCNCLEPCVKGCFCKADLVRDANNKCISARDCPKSNQ